MERMSIGSRRRRRPAPPFGARGFLCFLAVSAALAFETTHAADIFALLGPALPGPVANAVAGPAEPIEARLLISSDRDHLLGFGVRIVYDPTRVTLLSVEKGSGVPSSWSFAYLDTGTPGIAGLVVTDQVRGSLLDGPVTGAEALKLHFVPVAPSCAPAGLGFADDSLVPPDPPEAFPLTNRYLLYAESGAVLQAEPSGAGVSVSVADHSFLRGNGSNLGGSRLHLDIQDVLDLASILFGGASPIACDAAMDSNNDGALNIFDLVTLVQGIFNPELIAIPPSNKTVPGGGAPGAAAVDGGGVPSVLGCAVGQYCP